MPEPRQVPPNEAALVKRLQKILERREEDEDWQNYVKSIELNRKYAAGEQHDDDEGGLVRTNVIHSVLAAMVPTVYARDPEMAVTPRESVSPDRYEMLKTFGQTCEAVLRSQFAPEQAGLKRRAKSSVRSAMTAGLGWIKVIYQRDYQTDPLINDRINDVQDNLSRIKQKMQAIEDDGGQMDKDIEAEQEELMEMLKALQDQPEVVRAEGLIAERPLSEHVIWPKEIDDPDKLAVSPWLTHVVWMTEDMATEKLKELPDKVNRYESTTSRQPSREGSTKEADKANLVKVYEMWHLQDNRVYTFCPGWDGFVRDPYTPKRIGERFHCLFPLYFNPVDGRAAPLADVTLLRELQDEYNTTRTHFATHRKFSIPHWVGLAGSVTKNDANAIKNAEAMEVVLIEGDPSQPLRNYLDVFINPPIDPLLYDTSPIRQDVEFLMGQGDAARGSVANPKTATEAQILQQGLSTRVSERQDVVEDWFAEIARYSLEVCLQEMTEEQVKQIAGAAAQWPLMSKEDIYNMVQLEVKAGTSGKPDKQQEQAQWLEMLPELRETLLSISQLRTEGKDDEADILYKLTEETLRRFDEKIDLDSFFPQDDQREEEEQRRRQAEQQERQMQTMIQLRGMLAEINNKNADTIKKLADAEAAEEGQQMQSYMTQMQALESLITAATNNEATGAQ